MRNQNGQALVAALVITAILVGGLYAISVSLASAARSQRDVESTSDTFSLDDTINLLINNPTLCQKAFWDSEHPKPQIAYFDPDNPPSADKLLFTIKLGTQPLFSIGGQFDILSIDALSLTETDPSARQTCSGNNVYAAALNISPSKTRALGGPLSPQSYPLYLLTDQNTHQITGCSAQVIPCGCNPIVLDFESAKDPMGKNLGLTFTNDSGFDFFVADYTLRGKDILGFLRDSVGVWNQPLPSLVPRVGRHFLTTGGIYSPKADLLDITVAFNSPIASFSVDILDIDGNEDWTLLALDSGGQPLAGNHVASGDPGTGDATAYTLQVGTPSASIASVVLQAGKTGNPDYPIRAYFGYGLDNLAFSACPSSFIPTVQGGP